MSDAVELPERFSHGGATAYNRYRCRCKECVEWRRRYDRERWQRIWGRTERRLRCPGGWYVCVGTFGETYPTHERVDGVCVHCRGRYDYGDEE